MPPVKHQHHDLLNLPSRLFKYYRFDSKLNRKRLSGEIYMASPFDFNDPCDCQRDVINNSKAREESKKKGWLCSKLQELGYSLDESKNISKSLLIEDTYKYEVYKKQLEKVGILCLTRNGADTLMWGYYTNNDGYCIEYDTTKIVHQIVIGYINQLDYSTTRRLYQKDRYSTEPAIRTKNLAPELLDSSVKTFDDKDVSLISNEYLSEIEDKVKVLNFIRNIYIKRIAGEDIEYGVGPDGSPSNLFFDRNNASSKSKYYRKTDTWKHEQEFRIVASLGGHFIIKLGGDVVKNIYLGCNMNNEDVIELAYIISQLHLKTGLYKMKRLKNCGLQPIKLDMNMLSGKFEEVNDYLNQKCKLYW